MDFFKKQAQSFVQEEKKEKAPPAADSKKPSSEAPSGEAPSYQELMGSANVLFGAAKSQVSGAKEGGEPLDKAKLADAAEDILQGASHYGKLEGTAYGGYVKKAEGYLQTYTSREVPPEKKEEAAAELKAATEEIKGKAEVPKAAAPAVEEKIDEAKAAVEKPEEEEEKKPEA